MFDTIKKMMTDKGMELIQTETVTKILASEQVGSVVEKAMTVPFKISTAITTRKEKLVALLDLATQEDIDDIRRNMARVESTMETLKRDAEPSKK